MNPGTELDALVAEKLFGYSGRFTAYVWGDRGARKRPLTAFVVGNNSLGEYSAFIRADGVKLYCGQPHSVHFPPPFSQSIREAFDVVEKADWRHTFQLHRLKTPTMDSGYWMASFGNGNNSNGQTPEHAICLAALKVAAEPSWVT